MLDRAIEGFQFEIRIEIRIVFVNFSETDVCELSVCSRVRRISNGFRMAFERFRADSNRVPIKSSSDKKTFMLKTVQVTFSNQATLHQFKWSRFAEKSELQLDRN